VEVIDEMFSCWTAVPSLCGFVAGYERLCAAVRKLGLRFFGLCECCSVAECLRCDVASVEASFCLWMLYVQGCVQCSLIAPMQRSARLHATLTMDDVPATTTPPYLALTEAHPNADSLRTVNHHHRTTPLTHSLAALSIHISTDHTANTQSIIRSVHTQQLLFPLPGHSFIPTFHTSTHPINPTLPTLPPRQPQPRTRHALTSTHRL